MKDIIGPDLKVLFVGFNPGLHSGATGLHYAGRGNQFWRLLFESGLTDRLLCPQECWRLLDYCIGSTNLVARATRSAADLSPAELRSGMPRIRRLVEQSRPRIIAYAGKGVYLAASARKSAPWGLQRTCLAAAVDFIAPSPSGLVRMSFVEKLQWYQQLAQLKSAAS